MDEYEKIRPQLIGVAYRLLGTMAEAEDVMHDVLVKWLEQENRDRLENARTWMMAVCTNRCLDILKSARHKRLEYVGPWIPEPIITETSPSAAERMQLAASLTTAFLLVLERLTPKERAAFLLREVFGQNYEETAGTLGISEAACRQLVSRARRRVGKDELRCQVPHETQQAFLGAFGEALNSGDTSALAALLADDIALHADSGGKVTAVHETLVGTEVVCSFVASVLRHAWAGLEVYETEINAQASLRVRDGNGEFASVSFAADARGQICAIYIVRNPDKLGQFGRVVRHDASSGALWFVGGDRPN